MKEPSIFELLAAVRPMARHHGYAVAVHGSLARDIDLVAIPWTDDAVPADELVEVVRKAVDGVILVPPGDPREGQDGYWGHPEMTAADNPCAKPHGRLAWSIQLLGWGTFIDLSVTPRMAPLTEAPS